MTTVKIKQNYKYRASFKTVALMQLARAYQQDSEIWYDELKKVYYSQYSNRFQLISVVLKNYLKPEPSPDILNPYRLKKLIKLNFNSLSMQGIKIIGNRKLFRVLELFAHPAYRTGGNFSRRGWKQKLNFNRLTIEVQELMELIPLINNESPYSRLDEAAHIAVENEPLPVYPSDVLDDILTVLSNGTSNNNHPDNLTTFNSKFKPVAGVRFYGLEVEFNSINNLKKVSKTLSEGKLGEINPDSSCGHEFVSAPWEYGDMIAYIDLLPLENAEVDNRCGIHIHVSRDIFTPLMLGRLMVFINDPDNQDYIVKKVGRTANNYCQVSDKGKDPSKVKLSSVTRYEAINLTNLSDDKYTIEFRMFASTTDKQVIKGYLAWLDVMITLSESSNLTVDLIENAIT